MNAPLSRVWQVRALVNAIADSLAVRFAGCAVRGEISGFACASSGHAYFTLKDEDGGASLRCVMFRRALSQVDFTPGEGQLVQLKGVLSVYEARGDLQLVVEGMQRAGAGALYEQFLRLQAKLGAEGLFDAARKRPIVRFPRRIAVVTSLAAAALHDVLSTLRRRVPHVEVVVAACAVQGRDAPAQIVAALDEVARVHRSTAAFDAIVLCRGGGSLEDLWAFNDEGVVRAVSRSPVPVISGVGHETDITLADLVADLRAPTPTAAAELVAQSQMQAIGQLQALRQRLGRRLHQRLDAHAQHLDRTALRLSRPGQALKRERQSLAMLAHRAGSACQRQMSALAHAGPRWQARWAQAFAQQGRHLRHNIHTLEQRLQGVNPQRVLERGYAWISDSSGHPVSSATQAAPGQTLEAVLADGRLRVQVVQVVSGVQAPPPG